MLPKLWLVNEYGIGEFQKPSIPDVSEVKERLKRVLYREEMKSFLELERIKRVEEALEKQEKSKEAKINAENKIAEYNFNL